MEPIEIDFESFEAYSQGLYIRDLNVPWLGGKVQIMIGTDEKAIPERQKEIIRFACQQPLSAKDILERRLYKEYKSEIYGSFSGGDKVTPRISSPREIWKLISAPGIKTPYEHWIKDSHYFVVTFECVWDPEHGLAVLYNSKGEIVKIGGQGDF